MRREGVTEAAVRFFRELWAPTAHGRGIMLLSVALVSWCAFTSYERGSLHEQQQHGTLVLGGAVSLLILWCLGFSIGVIHRPGDWSPSFPPYDLMARSVLPSFMLATCAAIGLGQFVGVPHGQASLISFVSVVVLYVVVVALFMSHVRATQWAITKEADTDIIVADAFRYMWLFPAVAVACLHVANTWLSNDSFNPENLVSMAAAIIAAVTLFGFSSGYIP